MNIHEAIQKLESGEITPEQYRAWTHKPACSDCGTVLSTISASNTARPKLMCYRCGWSDKDKGSNTQGAKGGRTPEVREDKRVEGFNTHKI